jgi:hypothetical protein
MTERVISENPDHPATITAKDAVKDMREAWERNQERTKALREAGIKLYGALGQKFPAIGGTVWAAFNAVTELTNWRDAKGQDYKRTDQSVVFGSRADEGMAAYKMAMKVVGEK